MVLDSKFHSRDEFEILRDCLADMRSTLATMNQAMDRFEDMQKGGTDANGSEGHP